MKLSRATGIMAWAGAGQFWGLLGAVVSVPLLVGSVRAQQTSVQADGELAVKTVRQIEALLAAKAQRTPAQRKVSSQLLDARRAPRYGVARLQTPVEVAANEMVTVDIRADPTPAVLARIRALGGTVVNSVPRYQAIRARLPLAAVEMLAALDSIQTIRPADEARTRGQVSTLPPAARASALDSPVARKDDTSSGDVAHRANSARTTHSVDGTGIGIGVLSDGVLTLADRQASGDLPARVTVLAGQAGEGDEGTAMLEIVHDLAPGAELYFATASGGPGQFAANIEALCDAGADVIVDDIHYLREAAFQDDVIARGINAAVADGCFFFSAGGNGGNLNDGTAGVWEGDYAAGSPLTVNGVSEGVLHDFGGGVENNRITEDGVAYVLQWADPLEGSANDYDLFLIDEDGNVLDSSTNTQNGSQDPIEFINSNGIDHTDVGLRIVKTSGAANRYLRLDTVQGRLAEATEGNLLGHAAAEKAITVAAVDARAAAGSGRAFNGTESVRTSNSDGPRRIFFQPDGTPITAGNFSSTGGKLLQKPDLAAASCVATSTPGFSPFCGVSAAAPHAAPIAALMLEAAGGPGNVTLEALRAAMTGASLDIEATGVDRDSGAGIVMAPGAVDAVDVAVADRNQAPTVSGTLQNRTIIRGAGSVTVDVASAFSDPDNDTLTYNALSIDPDRVAVARTGSQLTLTPDLPGLAEVRVRATDPDGLSAVRSLLVTVALGNRDYDVDDDGLIEVSNLAQLDAVRYDLNGDGVVDDSSDWQSYYSAFAQSSLMGCPDGCTGYELTMSLDFDTNGDGVADAGDDYWNGGAGWVPIGGDGSSATGMLLFHRNPFLAIFDGNGHTVSNLFIDTDNLVLVGLFGYASSSIRNLGAIDVDVTGVDLAGGLIGLNTGEIRASYVTGRVSGKENVGGLVGINNSNGEILTSYATSRVSGEDDVGGLVGDNRGAITAGYATGRVSGIEGVGGLVGFNQSTGEIRASYATGLVAGDSDVGGLVGSNEGAITASYWDTNTSGHTTGSSGEGKTTAQLQAPTGSSGIYRNWSLDLDGDSMNDDPWHFGMAAQYPALKANVDGQGEATWQEFGYQFREGPNLTATAGQIQVVLTWGAAETNHWTPAPSVTYTLTRDDGTTSETLGEGLSGLSFTDTDVTTGTTYTYQVAAVVTGGEATRSALVSAKTTALPNMWLSPPASDPMASVRSAATYSVTFQGSWTTTVTSGGVPSGAHFTTLIGGVHNAGVTFLSEGGMASAGVELMAELGGTGTLANEVRAAQPDALSVLQGSGGNIGPTSSSTINMITLTTDHPRVTLLSMVAPSPDWFVGVSGLSLLDAQADWLPSRTVNLYPWDAGTEEGTEFSLSNPATSPQGTITSLRGIGKFSNEPIATLTFTRLSVNTAPVITTTSPILVEENETAVATLTATDADRPADDLTWVITAGADQDKFMLTADGQLTFAEAKDFEDPDDANGDGDYEVRVQVSDGANPVEATLTVRLQDVDDAAPTLSSATVDGSTLTLTYDEPLDGSSTPEKGDFTAAGGDAARTVSGVVVRGMAVDLTLDPGAEHGEMGIWVSYTQGTNRIRDAVGNDADGLSREPVANDTPDTTSPEVNSLAISSNPGSDQTYAAEDEIEVTVRFSETVEVEGTPQLRLRVGSRTRTASYLRGTDTTALVFGYEVADGDEDTDGVSIEADSLSRGSGTIRDEADNPADLDHEALPPQASHKVDGVRPEFQSAAVDGASLTLTYGEALDGGSRPASGDFTVEVAGDGRSVSGVSVSGSTVTLTLDPAVEHGETGIRVNYTPGSNRIRDAVGNGAEGLNNRPVTNTTGAPNTDPMITSPGSFDVRENQLVARLLTARDTDPGDEVTGWEIVGGADLSQFLIAPDTGELSFRTAPDYEDPADVASTDPPSEAGDNEYVVAVQVTSGAGTRELEAEQTLTVRVTDEREAPGIPEAPTFSGETADSLTVSWSEPDNSGPAITDYDVQYREKGTRRFTDGQHEGPGLAWTLSDLQAGTVYEVQVRATNDEGTSDWSETGEGMTVAPLRLEMMTMEEPPVSGPFTVRLSFSEPVTGFSTSDIDSGQDPACVDDQNNTVFCDPAIEGLQTTDNRIFTTTVTPWTDRVAHSYRLTLTVEEGEVRSLAGNKPNEEPEEPLEVRVSPPGAPEPISTLSLTASGRDGAARLSWNRPSADGGSAIIRYEYRYAATGEAWSEWEKVAGGSRGVTVGSLVNGREYIFEVRAVNALGKGGVETVQAVPERRIAPPPPPPPPRNGGGGGLLFPPEAPAGLMAMPGDGAVRLEWSPPESDGGIPIRRYEYRLKEGRGEFGEWTPIADSAPGEVNASGVTVGGLDNGTVYVFELRAVNRVGGGRVSEAVEAVMGLDRAYWSNFGAEDLQGGEASLERGPFGGGPQSLRLRFGAGLRFEESELDGDGEVTGTRMGGYGYRYTSRTTGELRLDYDGGKTCELRLTFSGVGAGSYSFRCGGVLGGQGSFELTGLNRAPEITSAGAYEVAENTARVGRIEAVDGDDEIGGYGIAGGADGALFAVEAETGELMFREAPDYETPGDVASDDPQSGAADNEYIVVVEVRSGEGERERKGRRAIRVRVSDEEEPPEITSLGPFEVVENRTRVGQLEAVDQDKQDEITGYGIAGGADGALFAVVEETGELMFREAPDYEDPSDVESAEPASGAADNEYIVVVEVRSGEGERERKGSRAIRVRVSDEEEPPEITSVGPFEVAENQARVGQLEAVDQDKQDEITGYGIAGGADGRLFAVEAGELMFREAPDYEDPGDVASEDPQSGAADNEYIVVVEVRSGEGERERKGSRAIRVRVSDEEEPPEITSVGPFEVVENRTRVGQLEAVDQDKQDEITEYGIAGGADGRLFAVEAGELMFREAPDYEDPGDVASEDPQSGAADNEYIVVVEVRSGEGERERKGSRAIRVRVSDEEEPPEITSLGPFEVVENRTRVGQVEAVDQDKQDEITGYGIAGGADGALFAVEAGELMFQEAPDYEDPGDVASEDPQSGAADNEYIVVVEVRSGEGERERKGSRAIRVRVSDEEEPPEITSLGPFEVVENQARVGQLEAVDQDKQDEITGYGIAGGADGALFAVEAGELMFRQAPDYEDPSDVESAEPASGAGDNEYIVVVEVRSGEGERERRGSRAIRVRVADEEEPPGAPAAPVVTAEGSDSLQVSWREPENRGPEIVDYEVRYREGGEAGYRDGGHEGRGLEVRLSGLKEGTAYQVQVRAVNEEGMSEWSEPGEGRTDTEEADPEDPSDFTEGDLEGRRLTLRLEGEEGSARSLELRFGEGNRFEQIESVGEQAATRAEAAAARSGAYTYQRTGPRMGTVRLAYDDGASCEIRLSFTESGVGAFAYDCGGGDPAEGNFRLTTGSLFVPVILSSAGQNQSFFTSELTLTNRGEREERLDYLYTAHIGGGSGRASEVLGAGMQKIETDALGYLRRLGIPIPETGNRIGTLRVEVRLGSEVEAVVRTTTVVPEGRAGLAYLGVAEEEGFDEAVYLCGLRQNSRDRSNVAFQNMGAEEEGAITVRTTVYSGEASDATARVLEDVTLEPGGFHQYSGLLGVLGVPAQGYVKVERVEGRAPFYAYGVINDQANSDGSFVFPVAASSLEGRAEQTLPVIVETSEFTSELTVTNFSGEARTLDFQFVAEGIETDDKTAGFSMRLEAGEQEIVAEVVDELRRQGVARLGSGSRALAGAVFATAAEGDMSGIVIGARTGSEGGGGQYSVFYNAVPFGEAFSQEAWVDGLQQNEENRSNLALVNTGEVDGSPSVFHLEIYDGETGMLAETVVTKPIPARRWHQINGILGSYAPETRQGYIRIEKVSGENPFLAYGVVNDGDAPGERSGDGAYLPARE